MILKEILYESGRFLNILSVLNSCLFESQIRWIRKEIERFIDFWNDSEILQKLRFTKIRNQDVSESFRIILKIVEEIH